MPPPSVADGGGLRIDVFVRPLDVLNWVYTTILADYCMFEMEASAMTDREKKSSSSSSLLPLLFNNAYRLVGLVFLTPHDILSRCNERRFECEMMENWRGMQRQQRGRGGPSVGNKTDPFVSVVYGDVMVQTEVINDSLSPMWMLWSSRAFVFQLSHPSAAVHVSVVDYDFGPLEHEAIGPCLIRIGRFHPGTIYTLLYNLYDSPNLTEKGEVMGTITVRLRVEINDEKR